MLHMEHDFFSEKNNAIYNYTYMLNLILIALKYEMNLFNDNVCFMEIIQ